MLMAHVHELITSPEQLAVNVAHVYTYAHPSESLLQAGEAGCSMSTSHSQ